MTPANVSREAVLQILYDETDGALESVGTDTQLSRAIDKVKRLPPAPAPMGSREEVVAAIRRYAPEDEDGRRDRVDVEDAADAILAKWGAR